MTESPLSGMSIGFVGAGNMAEAIAGALIKAELAKPAQIVAADAVADRREVFAALGCTAVPANDEVAGRCDLLFLAVKPQQMRAVAEGLRDALRPGALVVSIAAGVSTGQLAGWLPAGCRVVRVMPNTPLMVGYGVTGFALGPHATEADAALVQTVFAAAGVAVRVGCEEELHAITALSGSGPAYVFRFVESLEEAGVGVGLSADAARVLAAGTVLGAATLLLQSGEEPGTLRERVTSPGGTTAAALASLERDDFVDIVVRAVRAAHARSIELGGG